MKIKLGFVSNSSSSSFCILGFCFDRSKFIDLIIKYETQLIKSFLTDILRNEQDLLDKFNNNELSEVEIKDILKENSYELIEAFEDEKALSAFRLYDSVYVGLSFSSMNDTETLLQFKQRIIDEFAKGFINNKDISIYKEVIEG